MAAPLDAVNAAQTSNPRTVLGSWANTPSASNIYAALTQEQWENYVSTFVPIENQLIAYATDPSQVQKATDAAGQMVDSAYGVQAGITARRLAGMGTALTPEQQQAQTRETGLSKALSGVQARNMARDLTINRQQGILGNPAPTPEATAQQAAMLGS